MNPRIAVLAMVVVSLCALMAVFCVNNTTDADGAADGGYMATVYYEDKYGNILTTEVGIDYRIGIGYSFTSDSVNVFGGMYQDRNITKNCPLLGFTDNQEGTGKIYVTTGTYQEQIPSTLYAQYDNNVQWTTPTEGGIYSYSYGDTIAYRILVGDMSDIHFRSFPYGWLNYSQGGDGNSIMAALSGKATVAGQFTIQWEKGIGNFCTATINVSAPLAYDVSFSSEGSVIHTETVEPNSTVQSYTPSARDGYTFGGWYTDTTFQTAFVFNTPITSNITLYAKWIENPVTITFMVEGKVHSTLQVPKGSVGVVYTPVMVEGVFAGWYYDDQFQRKYDATVPLNTDTTLHALGVPPLIFTSEPNAAANIQQVNSYGMFFFDATDSSGRYQIHWDFGDGNTSDEAIAYNTYSEPGLYTVTLTVTNIYGESATSTYEIDLRDGSAANDIKWFAIGALCVIAVGFVIRRIL